MDLQLSGKRAFIGGGSQGLGLASAIELSSLGCSCLLVSRNKDHLQSALEQLDQTMGQRHSYLVLDYSDPESTIETVRDHLEAGNTYDILINNTGGPPSGNLVDLGAEDFQKGFDMHFHTTHEITRLMLPEMRKRRYGRIINILSVSAKQPIAMLPVSNMIRAGLAQWAKTLVDDVAPDGITVNNVLPGHTATDRLGYLFSRQAEARGITVEEVEEQVIERIPAGRLGEPKEFGSVVAFLCTPAAGYINGVNLPVDGGSTRTL